MPHPSRFSYRALLSIQWVILVPVLLFQPGCTPPDGGSTNENADNLNSNGSDSNENGSEVPFGLLMTACLDHESPVIADIVENSSGDVVEILGEKDENGIASRITSITYRPGGLTDEADPYTFSMSDDGWPTRLTGPDGDYTDVSYDFENDTIVLVYHGADESEETQTVQLSEGKLAEIEAEFITPWRGVQSRRIQQVFHSVDWDQYTATKPIPVTGTVTAYMSHYGVGTEPEDALFSGATLELSPEDSSAIYSVAAASNGKYPFSATYTEKDLDEIIRLYAADLGSEQWIILGASVPFVVLSLLSGMGWTLPVALEFWVGAGGAALFITGADNQYTSTYVESIVRQQAVADGIARHELTLTLKHENFKKDYSETFRFNLFNPTDPIATTLLIDLTINNLDGCPYLADEVVKADAMLAGLSSGTDQYKQWRCIKAQVQNAQFNNTCPGSSSLDLEQIFEDLAVYCTEQECPEYTLTLNASTSEYTLASGKIEARPYAFNFVSLADDSDPSIAPITFPLTVTLAPVPNTPDCNAEGITCAPAVLVFEEQDIQQPGNEVQSGTLVGEGGPHCGGVPEEDIATLFYSVSAVDANDCPASVTAPGEVTLTCEEQESYEDASSLILTTTLEVKEVDSYPHTCMHTTRITIAPTDRYLCFGYHYEETCGYGVDGWDFRPAAYDPENPGLDIVQTNHCDVIEYVAFYVDNLSDCSVFELYLPEVEDPDAGLGPLRVFNPETYNLPPIPLYNACR